MSVGSKLAMTVMRARFDRATAMAKRLATMGIQRKDKIKATITNIIPHALYGAEHASPTEEMIRKLTTAITQALGTPMGMKDIDWIFQISQAGDKDLDPVVQIFEQRVLALRRALARKIDIRSKVMKIISLYVAADEVSDGEGNTIPMDQPAPHPNLAARSRWMKAVRPLGPIGLLIQALRCIGV